MWGVNVGLILDEKRMMLLCCEPVQQILVKLTNHNEAWITQLPYLYRHNVRYRAGLDKCGGVLQ